MTKKLWDRFLRRDVHTTEQRKISLNELQQEGAHTDITSIVLFVLMTSQHYHNRMCEITVCLYLRTTGL